MKRLLLAIAILSTACTSEEKREFKVGDCIDETEWVQENRQLIGEYFKRIKFKSIEEGVYIVETCKVKEDSTVMCKRLDSLYLPAEKLKYKTNYDKIKCPAGTY